MSFPAVSDGFESDQIFGPGDWRLDGTERRDLTAATDLRYRL
jgi:hypothetical protein